MGRIIKVIIRQFPGGRKHLLRFTKEKKFPSIRTGLSFRPPSTYNVEQGFPPRGHDSILDNTIKKSKLF